MANYGSRESTLRHAGLLERGLAWFVDGIVLFIIALAVLLPVMVLFAPSDVSVEAAEGIGGIVGLLLSATYYMGSEATWGQTPGKMLLGIRVVQTSGRECTGTGAVVRNVTKLFGSALLPILVAIILILSTDENQRLGDMLGETTVVKT